MRARNGVILGGVALAVAATGFWAFRGRTEEIKWRQAAVQRGPIQQRISATGAVAPMVQVAVGTQVSGVISALYADFNSVVRKGQLIAQIDPTIMEANLKDAQATVERTRETLENAQRQYERTRRLHAQRLVADQDLDAAQTAFRSAKANLDNALAALDRAKANLGYCNIEAPVDGVVISRLADVGQTVAASFSTPNLFQIAKDLSKMKVETQIDEADIDAVQVGQRALFVVDSLPDRQFVGTVNEVRLEPLTTNNVVTYKVVIEVPNEPLPGREGALAPGLPVREARGARPDGPRGGEQAAGPRPGWGGRGEGAGPGGPEGRPRDPEQAWERMKDRLPPDVTKEAFIQRFKARMAQFQAQAPPSMPKPVSQGGADREAAARTPGGASLLGGPKFEGNVALRPGMTANVTIVTHQRADVLKVPNAALRFNPAAFLKEERKEEPKAAPGQGPRSGGGQGQGPGFGGGRMGGGRGMMMKKEDRIWVLEHGKPKSIVVKAGLTDGQMTEVMGEGLTEGMQVLVGAEDPSKKASATLPPTMGGMGGLGGMGGGRR